MSNYRVSYILDIMVLTIRYKKNVERCIEMETRSESGSINAPPGVLLVSFLLVGDYVPVWQLVSVVWLIVVAACVGN